MFFNLFKLDVRKKKFQLNRHFPDFLQTYYEIKTVGYEVKKTV